MPLIAVPNISTGSDEETIRALAGVVETSGAAVLDIHSDAVHDRSVFTVSAAPEVLIEAMVALARQARRLNLTTQRGVHPRLGVLDVCPFVPHGDATMESAISAAQSAGALIAERAGLPVYLYGEAAARPETRVLPLIRRGGLGGLLARASRGLAPDFGGPRIDERLGIVCVGARGVLIAFNVWLRCELETARAIAARVRESGGGLEGVRALGLLIEPPDVCQVSMNLTEPQITGIQAAFEVVEAEAAARTASVLATEIVGLPPQRFWPLPDARATRLLRKPGRTLEAALDEAGL
ncbi:MAG: glutamate formimidoyltransferase [Actinomycetota bacterium]